MCMLGCILGGDVWVYLRRYERTEDPTCLRLYNSGLRINFFNLSRSRTFFSSGPKLGYNRSGNRISGLQSILNLVSFSLGRGRSIKIDCMPPPGLIG